MEIEELCDDSGMFSIFVIVKVFVRFKIGLLFFLKNRVLSFFKFKFDLSELGSEVDFFFVLD